MKDRTSHIAHKLDEFLTDFNGTYRAVVSWIAEDVVHRKRHTLSLHSYGDEFWAEEIESVLWNFEKLNNEYWRSAIRINLPTVKRDILCDINHLLDSLQVCSDCHKIIWLDEPPVTIDSGDLICRSCIEDAHAEVSEAVCGIAEDFMADMQKSDDSPIDPTSDQIAINGH